MSKFPDPVSPPSDVWTSRRNRELQVLRAAKWGACIRFAMIALEFFGYYWYDSSAILLDAIASSIDLVSTLILIFFIRLASRPPDANHPFGHGRFEPIAGMQLGLLLLFVGAGMIVQQLFQLAELPQGELNPRAWIIPLLATLLMEVCYQTLSRAAKREHSPALQAEAMHYRVDALTSFVASAALIAGAFLPQISLSIDHIGAILIAIVMIILGLKAAKSNLDQVMDHVPEPEYFTKVKAAAMSVEGVKDTEKIRIQLYGPDAHIDIDVEVDPKLPVEEAHCISQKVRAAIQTAWPQVRDVTVHIEPYYPNDH